MKENLLKIIKHFGINNQQGKFNEETFELQEAIIEYEMCKKYAPNECIPDEWWNKLEEHIAEEIVDCYVLLNQFIEYYEIDKTQIQTIYDMKIKRTLERIDNNYYGK